MTRREAQRISRAINKQNWRGGNLVATILADGTGIRIDKGLGYAFLARERAGLFVLDGRHAFSGTPTEIAEGIAEAFESDAVEEERESMFLL